VLSEADSNLKKAMASSLWQDEQTRIAAWTRCDALFTEHNCTPARAGEYFVALESSGDIAPCDRIRLLSLADKWLTSKGGKPVWDAASLAALQKRIYKLHIAAGDSDVMFAVMDEQVGGWGTADASALGITEVELPCEGAVAEALAAEEHAGLDRIIGELLVRGRVHDALNWAKVFGYSSHEVILAQTALLMATDAVSDRGMQLASAIVPNLDGLETIKALRLLLDHSVFGRDFFQRVIANYLTSKTLNMGFRSMMAEPAQKVFCLMLYLFTNFFRFCIFYYSVEKVFLSLQVNLFD
jgi:hypothetical protein